MNTSNEGSLRRRMAEVYGVAEAEVLPVRGVLHGIELICRRIALDGFKSFVAAPSSDLDQLAHISRLRRCAEPVPGMGATIIASPQRQSSKCLSTEEMSSRAAEVAPALLAIDESLVNGFEEDSFLNTAPRPGNVVILRAIPGAGGEVAALIADVDLVRRLEEVLEPRTMPPALAKLGESALTPEQVFLQQQRSALLREERTRMCRLLDAADGVEGAEAGGGASVVVRFANAERARRQLKRAGVAADWENDGLCILSVGSPSENDLALLALGAEVPLRPNRVGEAVRETAETRIVACVDLDRAGDVRIETGVGFFDHMLAQVAVHGGFSLSLCCQGDLEVDAHHTIEDCSLVFGSALSKALGDRRGVARFGFLLPMDEAEARISLDLGGRPYLVFEGAFRSPLIGAYPTEMTEHVFRSLAQSLGAAIHVSVKGESDHHKTEACFKALGRALRQAIRVEGEKTASTKGVLL